MFRRADIDDVATAHLLALRYVESAGFDRLIISATTPFQTSDAEGLLADAPSVVSSYFPEQRGVYEKLGWKMFPSIGRVYDNSRARSVLNWEPTFNYQHILDSVSIGADPRSEIARSVGTKLYHSEKFADGPYPVD